MTIRHARTPSSTTAGQGRSRPPSVSRGQQRHVRRSSISSETESAISETITPVFANATGLFAPPGPSLPTPASISIPASASLGPMHHSHPPRRCLARPSPSSRPRRSAGALRLARCQQLAVFPPPSRPEHARHMAAHHRPCLLCLRFVRRPNRLRGPA
jgi:hypothetical protein